MLGGGGGVDRVVNEMGIALPFFWGEVPVCDSTVAQVFPEQDIHGANYVSHHAVTDYDDLFEAFEDLAYLFSAEPSHVAATRYERCFFSYSTAPGDSSKHLCACGT